MDDINFVDDIQPEQMNFDRDVARVDQSLLLELIGKKTGSSVEQRTHERFQVHRDAFALIRPVADEQLQIEDKSMAQIACAVYRSKPVRFGRIDNISMGGLLFRYIGGGEGSGQPLVLDILVAESGFYLENLTFKNISDFEIDDDFATNSFKMRLNRVQFEGLEPAAMRKLRHFIKNISAPMV